MSRSVAVFPPVEEQNEQSNVNEEKSSSNQKFLIDEAQASAKFSPPQNIPNENLLIAVKITKPKHKADPNVKPKTQNLDVRAGQTSSKTNIPQLKAQSKSPNFGSTVIIKQD